MLRKVGVVAVLKEFKEQLKDIPTCGVANGQQSTNSQNKVVELVCHFELVTSQRKWTYLYNRIREYTLFNAATKMIINNSTNIEDF